MSVCRDDSLTLTRAFLRAVLKCGAPAPGNGSGDLFLAFSTANHSTANDEAERAMRMLPNAALDAYCRAAFG